MIKDTIQYLIFNNKNILDFRCRISGGGSYSSSSWSYDSYDIPGRDGELIVSKKSMKNVDISYPASIGYDPQENLDALRDFLMQDNSYHRLEDTYHETTYMMARYKGDLQPEWVTRGFDGVEFTLNFSAIPKRYLKSGDESKEVELTTPEQHYYLDFYNPTYNNSSPIFEVTGNMTVVIYDENETVIGYFAIINNDNKTLIVDTEDQDVYDRSSRAISRNSNIVLLEFPYLTKGPNKIRATSTGTGKLVVTPRWYVR